MLLPLIILLTNGFSYGFFFGKSAYPDWDVLSVKFGSFSQMPRTENDALKNGWVLDIDACKNSTFYHGKRYIWNGETTTMLLFDKDGIIAGMQMAVPRQFVVPKSYIGKAYMIEGENYILTSYFTNPNNICDGKRKTEDGYVGDKLFLLTGTNEEMEIPLKESDITKTHWTKGRCFVGMGQHYWYNVSKDMSCDDFFPFFILYNGGELNAFGFATSGYLDNPSRLEHPTLSILPYFFKEPPACFAIRNEKLTTQHVYLQRRPYLNVC